MSPPPKKRSREPLLGDTEADIHNSVPQWSLQGVVAPLLPADPFKLPSGELDQGHNTDQKRIRDQLTRRI